MKLRMVINKSGKLKKILKFLRQNGAFRNLLIAFLVLDIFLTSLLFRPHDESDEGETIAGIEEEIGTDSNAELDDGSSLQEITNSDAENINYILKKGDSLVGILVHHNVPSSEAHEIANKVAKVHDLRKLSVGQELFLKFSEDAKLVEMSWQTNKHETVSVLQVNGKFEVVTKPITFKQTITRSKLKIDGSFIATAKKMGLSTKSIMEIVASFSYDVDFQRDIKDGHEIDVIFEKFYHSDSGEFSHTGNVFYSSLDVGGKKLEIYKFKTANGKFEYYKDDAHSIKKSLLRTPVKVMRISSNFGMRKHPILGYSKMHKGVDFAAPVGTPIFAAGNGVVEEIGWKGAYGKYIRLRHNNGFHTAYAHISKFARDVKKGARIQQGQVIAFVGKTGRATGAHLHYEVIVNSKQVNPLKIKLSPGVKLVGKELRNFNEFKKEVKGFRRLNKEVFEVEAERTNFTKRFSA